MNSVIGVSVVVAGIGLAGVSGLEPPAPEAGSVQPAKFETIAESARPVLERARTVLTGAKTIQGTMKMSLRVKYERAQPYELEGVTTYAVATPDKFYMKDPDGNEVIMGDKVVTLYRGRTKEYVQRAAPSPETFRETVRELSGDRIKSLPVYRIALTPNCSIEDLVGPKRRVTGIRAGEWKGAAGTWVLTTADDRKRVADDPPSSMETFYAEADGLPRFFRLDYTEQAKAENIRDYRTDRPNLMLSQMDHVTSAVWEVDVSDVKLNVETPPERFVFKPGPLDRKLGAFERESDEERTRPATKK